MNLRKPLRLIVAGLALTSLGVGTSLAAPGADAPSVTLRYAALDLTTQEGALRLEQRIRAAAERVCPSSDGRELERTAQARACQAHALARAVQQIGSPQLTALLAAQHVSGLKAEPRS